MTIELTDDELRIIELVRELKLSATIALPALAKASQVAARGQVWMSGERDETAMDDALEKRRKGKPGKGRK